MTLTTEKIDKVFLITVVAIAVFGLVMLTSASGPVAYARFGDNFYYLKHQLLIGAIPGGIAFLAGALIPHELWKKFALPMLFISIMLLLLVFIPGIGADFGTFAKSWVVIGGISFQPAEFVKLTFLFYLAAWLEKRGDDLKDIGSGLVPFLWVLGTIGMLIYLQPDLGTLSIIVSTAFVVYFVAGGPILHLAGLGLAGAGLFFAAVTMSPYRAARFMTFLHPELDPQGIGYQINQALLAVGSGGFFGRGYGHSLQKFQYLPEVIGDSIFAVVSEEMGFLFTALFVLLFGFFIMRGLKIAENADSKFGTYLAVGIIAWFGIQALVNVGAILGLMPLTGVPLPFLSYGGTSLVITLAASGVLLNISKGTNQANNL